MWREGFFNRSSYLIYKYFIIKVFLYLNITTIRSKAKLLLHGMKSLCYGDPAAFNSEAFGNQEDHHGLPLACGDNKQLPENLSRKGFVPINWLRVLQLPLTSCSL